MSAKLFIDGEHGTTGLQIRERLADRGDLEVLSLPHEARRDQSRRAEMLAACDIAILCLPDDASREAVALVDQAGINTRIIDTSTAHRTHADWVYGFAEIEPGQAEKIAKAERVSNPGCYSTGAIALLKPLISAGLMAADFPVTINAVSGYTGGGKQLIAQMEDPQHEAHIATSFHTYALTLNHKHVPEIMDRSGLARRPLFVPSVARFPQGMLVSIPLHLSMLDNKASVHDVHAALQSHYEGQDIVSVAKLGATEQAGQIRPEDFSGSDRMVLHVLANEEAGHVNLVAQLDNLGKGASGAAVQNLDLMIG